MTADATKTLERFASRGRWFDIVVCDPPTFSHGPAGQFSVARDLAGLAGRCAAVLAPGGFLVLASNSTKLSSAELDRALGEGARRRARRAAHRRARRPAAGLPGRARLPRGQLPQGRDRDPRSLRRPSAVETVPGAGTGPLGGDDVVQL